MIDVGASRVAFIFYMMLIMIQDGTTDWKVIAIDMKDPLSKVVNGK